VERDVAVTLERQNAVPGDRDFIIISYEAPLHQRGMLRSKLLGDILTRQRKAFVQKGS
jgi:hypothetical protein